MTNIIDALHTQILFPLENFAFTVNFGSLDSSIVEKQINSMTLRMKVANCNITQYLKVAYLYSYATTVILSMYMNKRKFQSTRGMTNT